MAFHILARVSFASSTAGYCSKVLVYWTGPVSMGKLVLVPVVFRDTLGVSNPQTPEVNTPPLGAYQVCMNVKSNPTSH